ncbi:MAG TPA: hypothetical protein VF952_17480 [Chloroflexia bacterium]
MVGFGLANRGGGPRAELLRGKPVPSIEGPASYRAGTRVIVPQGGSKWKAEGNEFDTAGSYE